MSRLIWVRSCVVDICLSSKGSALIPVIGQSKNQFYQEMVIFALVYVALRSNNILFTVNLLSVVAVIFSWNWFSQWPCGSQGRFFSGETWVHKITSNAHKSTNVFMLISNMVLVSIKIPFVRLKPAKYQWIKIRNTVSKVVCSAIFQVASLVGRTNRYHFQGLPVH